MLTSGSAPCGVRMRIANSWSCGRASSASRSRCRGRAVRPSGRRGRLGSPPRSTVVSGRRPSRPRCGRQRCRSGASAPRGWRTRASPQPPPLRGPRKAGGRRGRCGGRRLPLGECPKGPEMNFIALLLSALAVAGQAAADPGRRRRSRRRRRGPARLTSQVLTETPSRARGGFDRRLQRVGRRRVMRAERPSSPAGGAGASSCST